MTLMNRFKILPGAAIAALALLPILTNGCSSANALNPTAGLCCTDFKVGADLTGADFGVDASIKGQFEVFAQGAGDFSAAATGALDDVGVACRNIAHDLGAKPADLTAADAKQDPDRTTTYCSLAVAAITAFKADARFMAAGALTIQFTPPVCEASISAKGGCQAKCDVSGKCDIKANPPVCTGGKLSVECKGGCTAMAGATLTCEGSCTGGCQGSCEAQGGIAVDCNGKCEGTCTAKAGVGDGMGAHADGTCQGSCSAKCTASATAPAIKCTGSCNGKCDAKCQGSAMAAVKCDGKCDADFEPLKCEGGKLEGGCKVDAKCDANCDASVSAKAECHPPALEITAAGQAMLTGDAAIAFDAAITSLKVNLPNILVVFKARGEAFVNIGTAVISSGASISADPGKLGVKGAACALAIVGVLGAAGANVSASVQAAGSVAGSLSIN